MKKILSGLTGLFVLLFVFTACEKDDSNLSLPQHQAAVNQNFDGTIFSRFVDNNWPSTATLYIDLWHQSDTQFMLNQIENNADMWGRPTPPLYFVFDAYNDPSDGSTYNAISYYAGYIYYGYDMYIAAKNKGDNNIANVYVLAHEYAHQLQHQDSLFDHHQESTVRPHELEADAFAGYYLRMPNGYNQDSFSDIATAYEFAADIGDYDFQLHGHHGTPDQRRAAVRLGFLVADAVLYYNITNFTPKDFDRQFFKYNYDGVLQGAYGEEAEQRSPAKEEIDRKIAKYLAPYVEELQKIRRGEISAEQWKHLDN